MLASVLRLEALLKCDLCDNLLRSTRTLNECGHRFCENCIYDRLGRNRQCPKCHIPAIVKNLRKDPMHDTMVACVKKLKHCMMEADPASLSVPTFDATNVGTNDPLSHSSSAATSSQIGTIELVEANNTVGHQSTRLPTPLQPCSYDSDATTQSSQPPLMIMPEDTRHVTAAINGRTPPKLQCTPSTDDLLVAMEDEDVNEDDDLSETDSPTVVATKKQPISSPAMPDPRHHVYSSSDDLLAAMESEDIVMDDDDEPSSALSPTIIPDKSRQEPFRMPSSTRRRLSDNISAPELEPISKHPKTEPTSRHSQFTAPTNPPQQRRWWCSTCFYANNEPDHLICGICRKERPDDTAMSQEQPPTTVPPPTLDFSMPARFMVPSTLTTEDLQQQAMDDFNQDTVVRMMVTSLTAEDDAKLDIAMTQAIDNCLKMEIVSDTRDVEHVTHLITSVNDQGLCTRTIKYLLCIMTGKWIVNTSWLIDSVQAGYWLSEEKYQVVGDKTSGVTHGPARGRSQRQEVDFFGGGERFFFYGDFPDHDTKLKLLQLVRQGGGKIVSRRPSLDQLSQDDLIIIVASLQDTLGSRKKAHQWLDKCTHVKDMQWLLDSIARSQWVLK